MAHTYRRTPNKPLRKPRTKKEYVDTLSSLEDLKENGFEPDNRTRKKASAPTVDEYDDIFHSALEDKHNLI